MSSSLDFWFESADFGENKFLGDVLLSSYEPWKFFILEFVTNWVLPRFFTVGNSVNVAFPDKLLGVILDINRENSMKDWSLIGWFNN